MLKYKDNLVHLGQGETILYAVYNVQSLSLRWREHISCIMYRMSQDCNMLELHKPKINLGSNKKIKFKKGKLRQYEQYLNSPLSRGIKIWDMLTAEVQRATTKVKYFNPEFLQL